MRRKLSDSYTKSPRQSAKLQDKESQRACLQRAALQLEMDQSTRFKPPQQGALAPSEVPSSTDTEQAAGAGIHLCLNFFRMSGANFFFFPRLFARSSSFIWA